MGQNPGSGSKFIVCVSTTLVFLVSHDRFIVTVYLVQCTDQIIRGHSICIFTGFHEVCTSNLLIIIRLSFEDIFFYDTIHYNIKNWVWICWSGQDSNSRRHVLHAVNQISSLEFIDFLGWSSSVRTLYSADLKILSEIR